MPLLAVLVSANGAGLQTLIDARSEGSFRSDLHVVISNRPGVEALKRARAVGIEAIVIDHRAYESRTAFDDALSAALSERAIDLVVLAGFMRVLGPQFVARWRGRAVNLHPSLLPRFPGLRAIRDTLAAGVSRTGLTLHFIDEGIDTGPIIAQADVSIVPGDTEESLSARLHELERTFYPREVDLVTRALL